MKTIKAIEKEITKNNERQKAIENEIDTLSMIYERHAEADARNFEKVLELRDLAKANETKIFELSEELSDLKIALQVLRENRRAATVAEGLEALKNIIAKYDGKAYGEKTRDKIREEMRAKGFSFYFDGYHLDKSADYLKINVFNTHFMSNDYTEIYTSSQNPFIDADNKIHVDAFEGAKTNVKYSENVSKRVKEIKKAIKAHEEATAKADATQDALNNVLPYGCGYINNVSKYFHINNVK